MPEADLVFSILFALSNFFGILIVYALLERRTDRKIAKYWLKVRKSPEGEDFFALVKEAKNFVQSAEIKEMVKDLGAGLGELRGLLKQLREKAEASAKEEDATEGATAVLPPLE